MNPTYEEALVHLLEEYQLLHLSVGEIGGTVVATAVQMLREWISKSW